MIILKQNKELTLGLRTRRDVIKMAALAASIAPVIGRAQTMEVALAGFAFSGDAASLTRRFPYSIGYEKSLKVAGKPAFFKI